MIRRILSPAAVLAAAALALPAAATAAPHAPTFHRTFPVASGLCKHAQAGKLPNRLAASADQVAQDCATLQTAFASASSDLRAALAPVLTQASQLRDQVRQACQAARASGDRAACRQARSDARTTLASLRSQVRTAAAAYRDAANAARRAFWSAIRSLRGGRGVQGDAPVAQPQVDVPSAG